jgi:hypothetical protein
MSEEITATFMHTNADIDTALRWHCRRYWKLRLACFLWPFVFVLLKILQGLIKDCPQGIIVVVWTMFIVGTCGLVLWLIAEPFMRRHIKSSLSQQLHLGDNQKWAFSDEKLACEGNLQTIRLPWSKAPGSIWTPDGVLLYLIAKIFWLPKTAFTSEADYNRFLDLLAAKTKHSKLG